MVFCACVNSYSRSHPLMLEPHIHHFSDFSVHQPFLLLSSCYNRSRTRADLIHSNAVQKRHHAFLDMVS